MNPDEQNDVPQHRTWEHFSHAADIGVRGFGNTPAGASNRPPALTAVVADLDSVQAQHGIEIRCENPDPELLLVDWLNALVYEMAVRQMLFSLWLPKTSYVLTSLTFSAQLAYGRCMRTIALPALSVANC